MSTNHHRCICATCSKEMKPGQIFAAGDSQSLQHRKLDTSPDSASGEQKDASRSWNDRLLEWAKILLRFGYLLLAFFKT
ncbi:MULTISPECIES: hypothetical protein [unclassified Pseudomonas]|uniref:hypothetical protein n=1 Tax=unclassified Pseudomonas TaxID=196821 RepID=UPI0021BA4BF4|nr:MULTISPECIES: hypothetical protein [unclassified Pseudomonas]MCT8162428.1 hypothetical protein [Pseudomonas sp. HD6422]MCT8183746.1 hypothetical protein [Pseudomonas sp. HD6421]